MGQAKVTISQTAREAAERISRMIRDHPQLSERAIAETIQGAMDQAQNRFTDRHRPPSASD
jgi:hypothetical protein